MRDLQNLSESDSSSGDGRIKTPHRLVSRKAASSGWHRFGRYWQINWRRKADKIPSHFWLHAFLFLILCSSLIYAVPAISRSYERFHPDADSQINARYFVLSHIQEDRIEGITPIYETAKLKSGATMSSFLADYNVPRDEANKAIAAMGQVYSPRLLRAGQEITLTFLPVLGNPSQKIFQGFKFRVDAELDIAVYRIDGDVVGFESTEVIHTLTRKEEYGTGTITSSLSAAGSDANVPTAIMSEMIRAYSYDVDFQRDIQKNDRFEVYYESYYNDQDKRVKSGNVLYASLYVNGQTKRLYRFESTDGVVDYYNEKGQSVRKALMRTPIDGARMSSGFGMRRHPVLGYSKMHAGTDFAAPRGTPVYAAGDGVIEKASWWSTYGNYIRIRHNSEYKTAYAHLRGYAKGIKSGTRVRQGQVIGYVGTTGRSTGPHLHYEVIRNGQKINSQKMKLPTGRKLAGAEFRQFADIVKDTHKHIARLGGNQDNIALLDSGSDEGNAAISPLSNAFTLPKPKPKI